VLTVCKKKENVTFIAQSKVITTMTHYCNIVKYENKQLSNQEP